MPRFQLERRARRAARAMAATAGAILLLLSLVAPGAAEESRAIRHGGLPTSFLFWGPSAPAADFAPRALDTGRLAELHQDEVDAVTILKRYDIHLRADGDVESRWSIQKQLLTPAAVIGQANATFWVDAYSESAVIEAAYTLMADGTRREVDPETIQLAAEADDDIFSDNFKVIVPFSGVEPGARTVLVVKEVNRASRFPLPWSRILWPQSFQPVERFIVRLSWDESVVPPQWHSDHPGLRCVGDGPRQLLCEISSLAAFEPDEKLNYMDEMPSLTLARETEWAALAARETALFNQAFVDDPSLDQVLEQLLEGAEGSAAKLTRLYGFVSREIRYLGLEHGLGGVIPGPTARTLARRFGDCKDKTALFVDLARRAGLDAYGVITSTERRNLSKLQLPASTYFNHMVACVTLPEDTSGEAREICLDLTDSQSSFGALAPTVQGAIRLDLQPDTRAPSRLPADDFAWRLDVEQEITVDRLQAAEETQVVRFGGANAGWIRGQVIERSTNSRSDWLRDDFYRLDNDEAALAFEFAGLDDAAGAVVLRAHLKRRGTFGLEDQPTYQLWDNILIDEVCAQRSPNKTHDYSFSGIHYKNEMTLRESSTFRIAHLGAEIDFESPYGTYRRHYERDGEIVRVTTELAMPRATVTADESAAFNAFIEHVAANSLIYLDIEWRSGG